MGTTVRRRSPSCWPRLAAPLVAVALAACDGSQSAMDPRGASAHDLARLSWILFIGGAVIFLMVMALVAYAAFGPVDGRRRLGNRKVVVVGGIAFPVVTLSALLVYGLLVTDRVAGAGEPALRIEVVGERWWWRVHYLDEDGDISFASANEVRIPVGRVVEFSLKSNDVIHSFWVPNLGGKLDMIPGHVNTLRLQADEPGTFRGQCAEYCGGPHALMAFYVVAEPEERFAAWLEQESRPAMAPRVPFTRQGQDLFVRAGCGACHTVRGTPADGVIGPDLTHVGSRVSIGAGILPTNVGTLAGWIADSQHLKPDNLMPSFNVLQGQDLRAIAAYLESLK